MINYYEILNVSDNASTKEINKAYKREAFKWHPDKNNSNDAKDRMVIINEARLILIDDEARIKYDRELGKYKSFKASSMYTSSSAEEEYVFDDEILYRWIKNARNQAKEIAKASLDDLVGMSAAGASAFYHKTKYALVLYAAIIILVLVCF
ncbi:J domain-containing protein [Vibrio rarus]|uniref:J domain-containing protein n=1 Tax=Vibrio rarus TaxID=413403 RepID=UPI0021C255B3|nr:DnaJ domain-containing protein [Vibrio rarus]